MDKIMTHNEYFLNNRIKHLSTNNDKHRLKLAKFLTQTRHTVKPNLKNQIFLKGENIHLSLSVNLDSTQSPSGQNNIKDHQNTLKTLKPYGKQNISKLNFIIKRSKRQVFHSKTKQFKQLRLGPEFLLTSRNCQNSIHFQEPLLPINNTKQMAIQKFKNTPFQNQIIPDSKQTSFIDHPLSPDKKNNFFNSSNSSEYNSFSLLSKSQETSFSSKFKLSDQKHEEYEKCRLYKQTLINQLKIKGFPKLTKQIPTRKLCY